MDRIIQGVSAAMILAVGLGIAATILGADAAAVANALGGVINLGVGVIVLAVFAMIPWALYQAVQ